MRSGRSSRLVLRTLFCGVLVVLSSLMSLVRLVLLVKRLERRRAVTVSTMVARIVALVGRTIMCALGSSLPLGLLVMRRLRLRVRLVLLVRDMEVVIRMVMFVSTVLLDVRHSVESHMLFFPDLETVTLFSNIQKPFSCPPVAHQIYGY